MRVLLILVLMLAVATCVGCTNSAPDYYAAGYAAGVRAAQRDAEELAWDRGRADGYAAALRKEIRE